MTRRPSSDVWLRIQEAVRHTGRSDTQAAVARMLGISQPSVSEWATGQTRPRSEHYDAISQRTGFAIQYLRTGMGSKLVPPAIPDDDRARELLFIWERLSVDSRKALLQHAKLLRTIQDTADPARIREVHNELREANHRFREKSTVPVRR